MKKILVALGLVMILVIVAGIYRLNFTNHDIRIELSPGEITSDSGTILEAEDTIVMTIPKAEFEQRYLAMRETGAILIDVRTPTEYDSGHYEGAQMVDFYAPDFTEQLNALDKDTQYFIHCRSGSRSGQALRIMRSLGFTKVYDLRGGFSNAQDILTIVQ